MSLATTGQDTGWQQVLLNPGSTDDERRLANRRDEYVKDQFIKHFIGDYRDRPLVAAGSTLLLARICWHFVPASSLLAWLKLGAVLALGRFAAMMAYRRRYSMADTQTQTAFVRRWAPLAAATGVLFGSSVLLFFNEGPIGLQFVCWMIVVGSVTFALHGMAFDPPTMHRHLTAHFAVLLGCVLFRVLTSDVPDLQYESWFVVLPLVHWLLLIYFAWRIRSNAGKGFELEFYRQELIKSLGDRRRQAEAAVRVKNRFLAAAAHDMRQPVLALSLYADHLLEVPDEHRVLVPKIAKAAAAVNRLFESLFDLARMDNEQTKLRLSRINISDVMHDLVVEYQPIAAEKGIELRMHTGQIELLTDVILMRRMIGNVVSNAIKYTPPGRKVLISARVRAAGVLVEVWDQGIGIAHHELDNIFLEFYKVENASETTDGFGLGLSIVSRLFRLLNARVSVRSRSGFGTVFRFLISNVDMNGK